MAIKLRPVFSGVFRLSWGIVLNPRDNLISRSSFPFDSSFLSAPTPSRGDGFPEIWGSCKKGNLIMIYFIFRDRRGAEAKILKERKVLFVCFFDFFYSWSNTFKVMAIFVWHSLSIQRSLVNTAEIFYNFIFI